ncbi:MAG: hypothetical protein ABEH66_07705 [Halobacteriales archaeon]
MEHNASAIAAVGLVLAVIAAVPVTGLAATAAPGSASGAGPGDALIAADGHVDNDSANASANGSVGPGAMLTGVVGVQRAEIEGEVEVRSFGLRIANATSNASKASVVAEEVQALRDRLADLREEKRALQEARQNGSITTDQYKARLAALNTRVQSTKRLANQTEAATRGIPEDVLREKGVNVTAIRALRANASELAGPEVAAIARQIAGPDAGKSLGRGPGGAGPPGLNGSNAGPPDRNGSAGPPDRNGSAGSPDSNETTRGPAERNGSAGSPPADSGNQSSGNETADERGGTDGAPADGGENSSESAPDSGENSSEPGADGSQGGSGNQSSSDTTPSDGDDSGSGDGSSTSGAPTTELVERWRS